jgi:hypothetical protein
MKAKKLYEDFKGTLVIYENEIMRLMNEKVSGMLILKRPYGRGKDHCTFRHCDDIIPLIGMITEERYKQLEKQFEND